MGASFKYSRFRISCRGETLGFLNKLKLSGDEDEMSPPPAPKKSKDVPEEVAPPAETQTPGPEVSLPELPDTAKEDAPSLPQELPALDAGSQQEKPGMDLPRLKPAASQQSELPPPPAPMSGGQAARGASDIPPIKLDPSSDRQGIITDKHVEDLDVDKLVLPDQPENPSIIQAPISQAVRDKPLPAANDSPAELVRSSSPAPPVVPAQPVANDSPAELVRSAPPPTKVPPPAPAQHVPSAQSRPETPRPAPVAQSRPELPRTPAPPQVQQQVRETKRTYSGPLYVDVPTYEEMQEHIRLLKQDLGSVSAEIETIGRLNQQEAEEFQNLIQRLERVQDRVLGIDKSLFEER